MQTPRFSRKHLTASASASATSSSSLIPSPNFIRTERNTNDSSLLNLRTQIKDQMQAVASRSPNKNYISQKSQILLRIDNKLEAQIQRKITLQKLQSKMSIISMQSTKFKINRNRSMGNKYRHSNLEPHNKASIPLVPQFAQSIPKKHDSPSIRRDPHRQTLSSQLEAFRSYLKIIALNYPKNRNERKSEMLSRFLVEYFIVADESQVRKDLQQIKSISLELVNCLDKPNHMIDLNVLRMVDRDITKLVFNICYELYRKKQKGVKPAQLININKEIEYTSRRLKLYDLTLKTCFDLGKLYCDQMQYEKAFQQYTNAAKLAIFIDSKYYQEIAIDKLGLCKYYLGDSISAVYFHNNIHHLSNYDLTRVKAEYSNNKEIKRLIEEKKQFNKLSLCDSMIKKKLRTLKIGSFNIPNKENMHVDLWLDEKVDVGEFTFLKDNRNEFYPIQNNNDLKNNLKKIIKISSLRDKIHILKRNLSKNDLIGTKRYWGQNYIVPTASIFCRKENSMERNGVCLSHRSYNRNDVDQKMIEIDQDCKIIIGTLNYFINENIINQPTVREEFQGDSSMDQSRFRE